MHVNQQDCVARAVLGDKNALAELLETFGPDIEAGLRIGSRWNGLLDASDVMQATYLEAFMHIRTFDPARADAFPAWLRRMAENNLRDAIRALEARKNPPPRMRLGVHGEQSAMALFDLLTAGTGTPSQAARREESAARVRESMKLLPQDYARTIQLYDLEGQSVEEVASAMGRSVGAVYMLRMRGHDRLRELLGGASQFFESRS